MNNSNLIDTLNKEKRRLEYKIEHRKLFNIKTAIIRWLIKSGIAVDYALPFLVTGVIIGYAEVSSGNPPFLIDVKTEYAKVETIDTSSDIHLKNVSYDEDYSEKSFEYSTGWIINSKGLYERTATIYQIDDSIDLKDTEKIFSMTKEEVEKIVKISNIKTIQKNILDSDDYLYKEAAFIIINNYESKEDYASRLETTGENIARSLAYLFMTFGFGYLNYGMINMIIKNPIRDKLKVYEAKYKRIDKDDIEKLKELLELANQNISMISDSQDNNNEYQFKLRKA